MAEGTKELIELGARRFLDEIPALKQLKLVLRLDLRARRDSQTWRVVMPEIQVTRDPASDAKVTVLAPRSHFNELARDGRLTRVHRLMLEVREREGNQALWGAAGELGEPVRSYVARLLAIQEVLGSLPVED